VRLGARSTLFVVASRVRDSGLRGGEPEDRLLAALNVPLGGSGSSLGGDVSGQIAAELGPGDDRLRVDLQKSLPPGTGFGYRLSGDRAGEREAGSAELIYQNRHGRWQLFRQELDGRGSTSLQASGGLVTVGGRAYTSRPVQDSFALIRVPGVPHVRVYRSNQEIGRTDRRGDFLVPDLLSYYGNRLGIADQDVPMTHMVESSESVLAPPRRGGAVVRFPVWQLRAFSGLLVLSTGGGEVVPSPGRLTVTAGGKVFESPIGRNGAFYLENVPRGRHPAAVESDAGACSFELVVPETQTVLVDLGRVTCRPRT
jgi:outer membrane usher protein